jgi:predicted 3-demethylubiquinone-9 3-methyltransferase (glyoxalase superfamily)
MQKIIPFIWCVDNAKKMVEYYVSIFPGAKVTKENPMVTSFEIFGQHLSAMNG